ncbi:NADH-quinone oxidoreductase subunit N [Telmatobacter bradus]|uniref:NADH-quinone oxidoreductase subunit N n=1 Tax=Telmatobacter bradus TaxID=474953 RepID=UPI003B430A85
MNYADLFRVTLPETALEIAALLVLFVDLSFVRKAALKTRVAVASLLGIAGCAVALFFLSCAGTAGFSFEGNLLLASSGAAAIAQVGVLALTILTLLLFVGSTFTRHAGEYVAVVLMAAAGGLVVSAAQDLLIIFIGLELLSLGLYILTAFNKHSGASAEAALKYYLFGGMSAAFLLFGFSYFYGLTGSTNLSQIFTTLAVSNTGSTPLLLVAIILVVAGLGFKVAAVPFHLWAPDAYEGAPAPAAAFIASVSKVASFTLLLNFGLSNQQLLLTQNAGFAKINAYVGLLHFQNSWMAVLWFMAALSIVVGNLAALAQISVRRLLAYSAIAHAGYVLLGVPRSGGGVSPFAGGTQAAVLYYVITYGLTTIGAFGAVAVVERATGSDKLDAFLGLHKRNPLLAAVLMVFFLSLAGIPPLVGFWAKFNLFAAVLTVGAGPIPFALVALAIAMSAVSLYYYLQVLKRVYVMPAIDESPIQAHPVTLLTLVAIAAAIVACGCFPSTLESWIASAF